MTRDITTGDEYILKVEQITAGRGLRYELPEFCLNTLLATEPSNPDVANDKKMVMNRINSGNSELQCTVQGCNVTADRETLEVDGECKLASFCLKAAWRVRGKPDPESKELWDNTTGTSRSLRGSQSSGFACPNPECGFSAGWSVDGVPGTDGECVKE